MILVYVDKKAGTDTVEGSKMKTSLDPAQEILTEGDLKTKPQTLLCVTLVVECLIP